MRTILCFSILLTFLFLPTASQAGNLLDARQGFTTTLTKRVTTGEPVPTPPPEIFQLVHYPTSIGGMAAYVSPDPHDGKKHPVIIWLFGGFSASIDDDAWTPGKPENDQSATAFREAGILMMYPSLRGGNQNPGVHESFYGEVNDVLDALAYVSKLDYVDPHRIYLGGHSTGGTLALLVAESTDRFRAIFCFGPVASLEGYGQDVLTFDVTNDKEASLRAPGKWLAAVTSPTYIFEGAGKPSNIGQLRYLKSLSTNPVIRFCPVEGKTHFSILRPLTKEIAEKILLDDGPTPHIEFSDADLTVP